MKTRKNSCTPSLVGMMCLYKLPIGLLDVFSSRCGRVQPKDMPWSEVHNDIYSIDAGRTPLLPFILRNCNTFSILLSLDLGRFQANFFSSKSHCERLIFTQFGNCLTFKFFKHSFSHCRCSKCFWLCFLRRLIRSSLDRLSEYQKSIKTW